MCCAPLHRLVGACCAQLAGANKKQARGHRGATYYHSERERKCAGRPAAAPGGFRFVSCALSYPSSSSLAAVLTQARALAPAGRPAALGGGGRTDLATGILQHCTRTGRRRRPKHTHTLALHTHFALHFALALCNLRTQNNNNDTFGRPNVSRQENERRAAQTSERANLHRRFDETAPPLSFVCPHDASKTRPTARDRTPTNQLGWSLLLLRYFILFIILHLISC